MHVDERCYSTNIAELYKQLSKDCDISEMIQVLVTDNARNVASAVNKIGLAHIPCLAQSLQFKIFLGFKDEVTETLFVICRKTVGQT